MSAKEVNVRITHSQFYTYTEDFDGPLVREDMHLKNEFELLPGEYVLINVSNDHKNKSIMLRNVNGQIRVEGAD